jgi:hypothetical protein
MAYSFTISRKTFAMPTTYLTKRNNGIYYYGVRLPDGRIKWTPTRQTVRKNARLFVKTIGKQE